MGGAYQPASGLLGAIEQADGFDIVLTSETQAFSAAATDKLFFVNLGGHDPEEFTELHKNILIVAPDARAATRKTLSQIRSWKLIATTEPCEIGTIVSQHHEKWLDRNANARGKLETVLTARLR